MIQLLTYPSAFGQFSASPFCVKAAYLLNLSGQTWEREDLLDPRKTPMGKLPVIRTNGSLIADSDNIRRYLEAEGACFEKDLSDLDKANARAFIRMAEEHIYFHVLLDRWADDAIWPTIRDIYFKEVPKPLRGFIAGSVRKKVLNGMHHQGLGRFTKSERLARLEPDLEAITNRLWHGKFLFGDTPSAADASVAPMLAAALSTPVETPVKTMVSENEVLMGYLARAQSTMG